MYIDIVGVKCSCLFWRQHIKVCNSHQHNNFANNNAAALTIWSLSLPAFCLRCSINYNYRKMIAFNDTPTQTNGFSFSFLHHETCGGGKTLQGRKSGKYVTKFSTFKKAELLRNTPPSFVILMFSLLLLFFPSPNP